MPKVGRVTTPTIGLTVAAMNTMSSMLLFGIVALMLSSIPAILGESGGIMGNIRARRRHRHSQGTEPVRTDSNLSESIIMCFGQRLPMLLCLLTV